MILSLALLACSPATVELDECPDTEKAIAPDDSDDTDVQDTARTSAHFADTLVEDWYPVRSGNWPNALTADACDNASGPTCYDCIHTPTGTYARWLRQETEGGGYADDIWLEAALGVVSFPDDFDPETGGGLDEGGVYYSLDPVSACAPAYWLYDL